MSEYTLLGTEHCHLCEEAESILLQAGLSFTVIDIADDDALVNSYGLHIPVLRCPESGNELNWPFNLTDVQAFTAG